MILTLLLKAKDLWWLSAKKAAYLISNFSEENMEFFDLFKMELGDIYNAEHQIIEALNEVIPEVTSNELREALMDHLDETENQVQRLERIFELINEEPHDEDCEAMRGILEEGREIIHHIPKSTLRDAALIGSLQKVEHYEIAAYGTLYSHADLLELDSEILTLLDDSLDEESNADKKLTSIAEGGFFTTGINKAASNR